MVVFVIFLLYPTRSTSSPTLTLPVSMVPVTTVPLPYICKLKIIQSKRRKKKILNIKLKSYLKREKMTYSNSESRFNRHKEWLIGISSGFRDFSIHSFD